LPSVGLLRFEELAEVESLAGVACPGPSLQSFRAGLAGFLRSLTPHGVPWRMRGVLLLVTGVLGLAGHVLLLLLALARGVVHFLALSSPWHERVILKSHDGRRFVLHELERSEAFVRALRSQIRPGRDRSRIA